jgi:hypothetical protein
MTYAYAGQFAIRTDPKPDDGRVEILGELKKLRPTRPDSLRKRASDTINDGEINKMLLTTAERRERGIDTLELITKIQAHKPTGSGLFLPELGKVQLPSQSSNGRDTEADPRRAGATAGIADVDPQSGGTRAPALMSGTRPHSASVSSRRAGPEDEDIDGPLKARPDRQADLDDLKSGPLDVTTKAIRAAHRNGPRRLW